MTWIAPVSLSHMDFALCCSCVVGTRFNHQSQHRLPRCSSEALSNSWCATVLLFWGCVFHSLIMMQHAGTHSPREFFLKLCS
uniref:Uncharacterized protein n=1 Tax=Rhipicephalus microplus TaxID=6941 RepID=A0A6G5A330_RHIMP